MIKLFMLVTGGTIGAVARYALSGFAGKLWNGTFPYGTLMVNLIGSFLIGFLWSFWESGNISNHTRTFLFVGILGSFTTFSAYTIESLNLFREGETKTALLNILTNNVLGLLLVFIGFFTAKEILNLFN